MGRLIREFPFATVLALAGFFLGVSLLFSADFFTSYDMSSIAENPISSVMNYIKDSSIQAGKVLLKGVGLGLAMGTFFGLAGFIIDFLRRKQVSKTAYGGKIQRIVEMR
ncbi:MAG: hypothetical protein KJ905_01310 [Nanoarchaeota archaeon]|nr:hypothetical protein [Nanoarchaeota archaeon]MBU1501397.1 hypothetical protein [Nanoarchaeota archaeon]MBU2459062.1 hypothetical protein [Nanoarchaeota archaeon]